MTSPPSGPISAMSTAASPTCTSSIPRRSRSGCYFAALDGSGFPAKATGWLATARDVGQMNSHVHRRRHVRRRGRRARTVRLRQERRLGAGGPARHAAAGAARRSPSWPGRANGVRARSSPTTRSTPAWSNTRRPAATTCGQYRLAGGRRGLGGHARHVRAAGGRGRARRGVLGVAHVASTRRSWSRSSTTATPSGSPGAGLERLGGTVDRPVDHALSNGGDRR